MAKKFKFKMAQTNEELTEPTFCEEIHMTIERSKEVVIPEKKRKKRK